MLWAKREWLGANAVAYCIYSNKHRGAYLIFRATSAVLLRRAALINYFVPDATLIWGQRLIRGGAYSSKFGTHFLRSSSLNKEQLTVQSSLGDRELLSFVSFLWEATSETKKKHSLCCGKFQFLLVPFRDTTTCREGGTKTDQIDDKERYFWRSVVKTKHQSLTSLACRRLVLGGNRAVRHICIRCIGMVIVNLGLL